MDFQNISIVRYQSKDKNQWNQFVDKAVNGLFLFKRQFMEYHSDRFKDQSLMIYNKKQLIALFPAHIVNDSLCSHNGLSFGGLVWGKKMNIPLMEVIWKNLEDYCHSLHLKSIVYKSIPWYYKDQASEEDLFVIHKMKTEIKTRVPSIIINLRNPIPFRNTNLRVIKGIKSLNIRTSQNFTDYYHILENLLKEKYNTSPVHSLEELEKLTLLFPNNIHLHSAYNADNMMAGILTFEYKNVIKAQYIASTKEGNSSNALIFLVDHLLKNVYKKRNWFDLGTCQNLDGTLNYNLARFKNGTGGRAVLHTTYKLSLN